MVTVWSTVPTLVAEDERRTSGVCGSSQWTAFAVLKLNGEYAVGVVVGGYAGWSSEDF